MNNGESERKVSRISDSGNNNTLVSRKTFSRIGIDEIDKLDLKETKYGDRFRVMGVPYAMARITREMMIMAKCKGKRGKK
jgi:hypothetical protein